MLPNNVGRYCPKYIKRPFGLIQYQEKAIENIKNSKKGLLFQVKPRGLMMMSQPLTCSQGWGGGGSGGGRARAGRSKYGRDSRYWATRPGRSYKSRATSSVG